MCFFPWVFLQCSEQSTLNVKPRTRVEVCPQAESEVAVRWALRVSPAQPCHHHTACLGLGYPLTHGKVEKGAWSMDCPVSSLT